MNFLKFPPMNTTVQLSTPYAKRDHYNTHRHRQTDRQHRANSVRSSTIDE